MCRFQKCLYLILRMLPRRVTGFAEKSSSPLSKAKNIFYQFCSWFQHLTTQLTDNKLGRSKIFLMRKYSRTDGTFVIVLLIATWLLA